MEMQAVRSMLIPHVNVNNVNVNKAVRSDMRLLHGEEQIGNIGSNNIADIKSVREFYITEAQYA